MKKIRFRLRKVTPLLSITNVTRDNRIVYCNFSVREVAKGDTRMRGVRTRACPTRTRVYIDTRPAMPVYMCMRMRLLVRCYLHRIHVRLIEPRSRRLRKSRNADAHTRFTHAVNATTRRICQPPRVA